MTALRIDHAPLDVQAQRQAAFARIRDGITPLEPRVLLDAVLDLDPGGTGLAMFHAVAGSLDAQAKDLKELFDTFEAELADGLGIAGGLIDPKGEGPALDADSAANRAAAALMEEVRGSLGAVAAAFEARLDWFVATEAAGIASTINAGLGIPDYVDAADLRALLTLGNLADGESFEAAVAQRFDSAPAGLADTIGDAVGDRAEDVRAALFGVALDDVSLDGDAIVAFTALGGNRVGVTVTPPEIGLNLGQGFGIDTVLVNGGAVQFSDFAFGYEIEASGGAIDAEMTITLDSFDFERIAFAFAGEVGLGVELGLLSGALEEIDSALFRLDIGGFDTLSLTASYDSLTGADTVLLAAPVTMALAVQPLDAGGFTLVANDVAHDLLRLGIGGTIGMAGGLAYRVDLTLGGILASADADQGAAFLDGLTADLDVAAPSGDAALAGMVAGAATLGGADLYVILSALADDLSRFFRSSSFDFQLPFTDLRMREAFNAVPQVLLEMIETFEIDLAALGLADTAFLSPASTEITGRAVDRAKFEGVERFRLVMPKAEGDIEILVQSPHAAGGFATHAELASAISAGLQTAGLNAEAVVSGSALSFRLLDPAGEGLALIVPYMEGDDTDLVEEALEWLGFDSAIVLGDSVPSHDFGAIDLDLLHGAEGLRFTLTENNATRLIDIPAGNLGSLASLAAALDAALAGSNLEAKVNDGGDGLAVALRNLAGPAASLGIEPKDAIMARSLDGLLGWVSEQLSGILPGIALTLDGAGGLRLAMPGLGDTAVIDDAGMALADPGFDILAGLDLAGRLSGSIEARLDTALVVDLKGYAEAFADGAGGAIADRARLMAGQEGEVRLLDHVRLSDSEMFARIAASAAEITGTAELGMLGAVFGSANPSLNTIAFDAQLLATFSGEENGAFVDATTLAGIRDALDEGRAGELLGRFELKGGLLTDADGVPLLDGGELRRLANAFETAPGAGEIASFAVVRLGDVRIERAGVTGLAADAINGLSIAMPDLFDSSSFLVVLHAPSAAPLARMQGADLIDSLSSLASLLQAVGDALAENLPFLASDIPLFNFGLLDIADFGGHFLTGLQDFRGDPGVLAGDLVRRLDAAFGDGASSVAWNAASSVLELTLDIDIGQSAWSTPFAFDLKALLGAELETVLGSAAAEFVSGLVDARGDGALKVTPDLGMTLAFGIDLSGVLAATGGLAEADTALGMLATVATIVGAKQTGRDELRITRIDRSTGGRQVVELSLAGAETVADVEARVGAALAGAGGAFATTSFAFDEAGGRFVFTDTAATAIDTTGVDALFGGAAEAAGGTLSGTANVAGLDAEAAYAFDLIINGVAVTVALDADPDRTDLVAALQAALQATPLPRLALSGDAFEGASVPLGQLVRLSLDGTALRLDATNFAEANGYAPIAFSIAGIDASPDIAFTVTEIGGSNAARLIGFASGVAMAADEAASAELHVRGAGEGTSVFLDTERSGLRLELEGGVAGGLNLVLGFGPIEVNVTDGRALLGDGAGGAARLHVGFNDIDGGGDGRVDLASIADAGTLLDLLAIDAAAAIDIDLAMSDSLGLFKPAEHGFSFDAALVATNGWTSLAGFDAANARAFAEGALVDHWLDGAFDPDDTRFDVPDLDAFFADLDVLDLINDPRTLLRGLDTVVRAADAWIGDYLRSISLPIIGDQLAVGVGVFQDIRHDILAPALTMAARPKADGSLPTTTELLNGFVNDQLNELFGTEGATYMRAYLHNPAGSPDPYIYGALSFEHEFFSSSLDLGFDFGVPGLGFELKEGSALDFSVTGAVNIAFGIDEGGIFFLNDTDLPEIELDFTVDAGAFQGSFEYSMLRFSAYAVDSPIGLKRNEFVEIPDYAEGERGEVFLKAALEVDLFGDTGQAETRDIAALGIIRHAGTDDATAVSFERSVRYSELRLAEVAAPKLTGEIEINLQLVAEVVNPVTGEPITAGGGTPLHDEDGNPVFDGNGNQLYTEPARVVPGVVTEFVLRASYDSDRVIQFDVDRMMFNQLRVDASDLYETFIAPLLDPIRPIIEPVGNLFEILDQPPMSFVIGAIEQAFPVLRLASTVFKIVGEVSSFANQLAETDGMVVFGTYDFGLNVRDMLDGNVRARDLDIGSFETPDLSDGDDDDEGTPEIGNFGSKGGGLEIRLPILTDPMNALNLVLGRFEQVSLVEAEFSLINLDIQVDLVEEIISLIGGPKVFAKALSSVLSARLDARAFMGFTVGYDLTGITNFANTLDPGRILDGIYLDSNYGGLIDFYLGAYLRAKINLGIISGGVGGGAEIYFNLGLNDPNNDGRLRIPEMIAIARYLDDIDAGFVDFIETVFKGSAGFKVLAEAFATINLLFTKINFDVTIFDFGLDFHFGGKPIGTTLVADLDDTGGHAILNIGSRATANMSSTAADGDESVRITGPHSPYQLIYTNNGVEQPPITIPEDAASIVIPAGEGDNVIDLRGIDSPIPTLTFTGSGDDEIWLPSQGFHVVFAGGGGDTIRVEAGATGTYWVFGEADSDTIELLGGDTMVFAADDYGLRDRFAVEFMGGGFSQAAAEAILANPWGSQNKTLAQFKETYTQTTQLTANSAPDTVKLGGGDHLVFAGAGADVIETLSGSGAVEIYAGAGDDEIRARGDTVLVEAGAGSDLVVLGNGTNTAYGWGAALGADGVTEDDGLKALGNADGDDVIIGGSGQDVIHGQRGDNILMGGLGDDVIHGGRGNDIMTGGIFAFSHRGGAQDGQAITTESLWAGLPGPVTIETANAADGDDVLHANGGGNVVFGGGGDDTINGGSGANLLIGDFGAVEMAANRTIERFRSTLLASTHAGADAITGGEGNDIMIGGGADGGATEYLTAMLGANIVIGDAAEINGARIMEKATQITSLQTSVGNPDVIRTGAGHDIIFGGEAEDDIGDTGGANIVAGDLADLDLTDGSFASIATLLGGGDDITIADAGDNPPGGFHPANMVIGGGGDDEITLGRGDDTIIGDDGEITFDAIARQTLVTYAPLDDSVVDPLAIAEDEAKRAAIKAMVRELSAVGAETDGDDTLTKTGGDNYVILGGGDDIATLGDGRNFVLGDSGTIDIEDSSLTSPSDQYAGDDSITAGDGDNMVIAGSRADTVSLGDGDNLVLGDTGEILYDSSTFAPIQLTSAHDERDGADGVTAGDGRNFAILGGTGDTGTFGDGGNRIIGDSGVIRPADPLVADTGFMRATEGENGAADTITAGTGGDFIIGGAAGDTITDTGGDNAIIGDSGAIRHTDELALNRPLQLSSLWAALGGADTIATGMGHDLIIGGAGGDTITSAGGDNIVIGDWAVITTPLSDADGIGRITSTDMTSYGHDSITTGAGQDIVIGGGGDDVIEVGAGADTGLGDYADITYRNRTDVETLTLVNLALGGDDTLSSTGPGDTLLIGQAGRDTITGGLGDDILIGDLTLIRLLPLGVFGQNESFADRIEYLEYIRPDLGFNDVIHGTAGRNLILGGFGGDRLTGGVDQDIIFGDSFLMDRTYTRNADGTMRLEEMIIRSNFAYLTGGYDIIEGGPGNDIMVGHLGRDLFIGDTENDFLAGDTIWLRLQGIFTSDFTVSPFMEVIQVNFPGFGAPDVVSGSQINQAIGAPLDSRAGAEDPASRQAGMGGGGLARDSALPVTALSEFLSDRAQSLFSALMQALHGPETLARITESLSYDLDLDLLLALVHDEIVASLGDQSSYELSALDRYLLMRLFEEVIRPAVEALHAGQNPAEAAEAESAADGDAATAWNASSTPDQQPATQGNHHHVL